MVRRGKSRPRVRSSVRRGSPADRSRVEQFLFGGWRTSSSARLKANRTARRVDPLAESLAAKPRFHPVRCDCANGAITSEIGPRVRALFYLLGRRPGPGPVRATTTSGPLALHARTWHDRRRKLRATSEEGSPESLGRRPGVGLENSEASWVATASTRVRAAVERVERSGSPPRYSALPIVVFPTSAFGRAVWGMRIPPTLLRLRASAAIWFVIGIASLVAGRARA
jgi:hypothetical protein